MAIQFPNFLQVPVQARDYSGIGDMVDNFYKGYNMPNDALIKEIQAKFAQPNAEADLKATQLRNAYQSILNQYAPESQRASIESTRLSNRKSQMDLDKLAIELQQQRELERQLQQALTGGASQGASPSTTLSSPLPSQVQAAQPIMPREPVMPQVSPDNRTLPNIPKGIPLPPAVSGMTLAGSSSVGGAPAASPSMSVPQSSSTPNVPITPAASAVTESQPAPMNEVVITKGAPQLAGIDAMYDSNPLSRAFLEKKGYKKSQEVKFDNKTGRTTIITKYPSGKVTVQASAAPPPSGEGIPLTNAMITRHQKMISSIDNALPIIQQIIDRGAKPKGLAAKWEPYPRNSWIGLGVIPGFQSSSTDYEALVSSALDSLIGAYGLPSTNEGIETVKKQLLIGHGETDSRYRNRLKNLITDLKRRKSYSSNEVKKSNNITPVDSSASGNNDGTYSSNEWEEV